MKIFKDILRNALKIQAEKVFLIPGQAAKFLIDERSLDDTQSGVLQKSWLLNLSRQLLSEEQLNSGEDLFIHGSFQLQGNGEVFLLFKRDEDSGLFLFMPPAGEQQQQEFLAAYYEPEHHPVLSISLTDSQAGELPVSGREVLTEPFSADDDSPLSIESSRPIPFHSEAEAETNPLAGGFTVEPFEIHDEGVPDQEALYEGNQALHSDGIFLHGEGRPNIGAPDQMISSATERSGSENEDGRFSLEGLSEGFPPDMALPEPSLMNLRPEQRQQPLVFPDHEIPHHSHGPVSSDTPQSGIAGEDGDYPQLSDYVSSEKTETDMFAAQIPGSMLASSGEYPIDNILRTMIEHHASDLHLTSSQPIILRIDGEIYRVNSPPLDEDMMRKYLLPIMPDIKKKEFSETWDVDFAYELSGLGRFRVNMFRDHSGVAAVLRHIPEKILSAETLGLSAAITRLCQLSKGLVLVTGPTGSGKSTTLAAMLDLINEHRREHILTIEDPIEFIHPQKQCLINQREVSRHTCSFSHALRAALREDPDIVLVGELRDLETTAMALETAETGHLVFATMHTNTAVSTIDRIIDQFPSQQQRIIRNMLASSVKGIVAQTLCKRKGGGRIAAHEILIPTDAVAAMIRDSKNHMIANHMQSQQSDGNMLMNEALIRLVSEGLVDYREARSRSVDKKDFDEQAKRKGVIPTA